MKYIKKIKVIHIIIFLFFFINLFFLTNFPFIHSDEAWLSGLSRNILQKENLAVTESFFDLYPRHPHAIKILFHLLQIVFIKLSGYNIYTFRLISLLAATGTLYLFYKITKNFTDNYILTYMATIMMGLDLQFIYASHFARQEIILLFVLLIAFYYFLFRYSPQDSIWHDILMGLILGSGIGIHPNSFVIALPFIFIYTYKLFTDNKYTLSNYLTFNGILGLIALIFIILSFKFDPNFIQNYSSYGQRLGVFSSILTKIDRLKYFYKKLFYGVSGTYYTPPIKFQFIIFTFSLIYAFIKLFFKKNKKNFSRGILILQ